MKQRKPVQLRVAVGLLYASLVVGMVVAWVQSMTFGVPPILQLLLHGGTLLVMVILIEGMAAGRNWARVLYLLMAVVGLPLFLVTAVQRLAEEAYLLLALGAVQWLVALVVLYLVFFGTAAAWFASVQTQAKPRPRWLSLAVGITVTLVLGFAALMVMFPPFKTEKLVGNNSMTNTVELSDSFFASRLAYLTSPPQRGDVIVFKAMFQGRKRAYLSRIVGLPGDTIEIRENRLLLNGVPVGIEPVGMPGRDDSYGAFERQDSYIETLPNGVSYRIFDPSGIAAVATMTPRTLPADRYFVMGDNRVAAVDSRNAEQIGDVAAADIVGKAIYVYDAIYKPRAGRWIR